MNSHAVCSQGGFTNENFMPAIADDMDALKADAYYQDQEYYSEQAYTACYEHLVSLDPTLLLASKLENCDTDSDCEDASTLCPGLNWSNFFEGGSHD
jgi:hypothetical protein